MRKIAKIKLQLSKNILDVKNSKESEHGVTIPLKRTRNNNKYYDDTYVLLARNLEFTQDNSFSNLSLCVEINPFNQYRFFLCADYKELNMRESTEELLERESVKQEISLSDEEIIDIRYVIKEICVA